jgi:hypothetical protein
MDQARHRALRERSRAHCWSRKSMKRAESTAENTVERNRWM